MDPTFALSVKTTPKKNWIPSTFATAARAYKGILESKKSQVILILSRKLSFQKAIFLPSLLTKRAKQARKLRRRSFPGQPSEYGPGQYPCPRSLPTQTRGTLKTGKPGAARIRSQERIFRFTNPQTNFPTHV